MGYPSHPVSAPRIPILVLVVSLAVVTVVVFWAYAVESTEPGTLQVYPRPDDAVGSPAALVAAEPQPVDVMEVRHNI